MSSALRVLMLAHNHAAVTAEAVGGVVGQLPEGGQLLLLDNASNAADARTLRATAQAHATQVELIRSDDNLGFAGGMNRLIARALDQPSVEWLLLLNNDVLLQPQALATLLQSGLDGAGRSMVAARMQQWQAPTEVDSLGIVLYRSGLASNRKREDERLLGPTGGCMLLSRRLLEDMQAQHGYWFDEHFFCYAEDTDLVMRARWLGYDCVFAGEAVVLHHGSLSSGGPDNEFVLYHGIRNSIWALIKNAPALWLLVFSPWIVAAHAGVWLRNLRKRRWRTLWRLYRDAVCGVPAVWRQRRVVRRSRRVPARVWWGWVEPSLYERDYLRRAWRELFRRADR